MPVASDLQLDTIPVMVRFSHSVTPNGPERALCFDFDRPRDAHHASEIEVILIANDGTEDVLQADVDQTGESAVCLRDSNLTQMTYIGARLRAPHPMLVRKLFWGAPEQPNEPVATQIYSPHSGPDWL